MYRGQTLVCKLSFAFILYGNRSSTLYLTFHSFSLTQLWQSKQLILRSSFKVRGSAFSSPRLVQIPRGGSRCRKPGEVLFLEVCFSILEFLLPSPRLRCRAWPQTSLEGFRGDSGRAREPRVSYPGSQGQVLRDTVYGMFLGSHVKNEPGGKYAQEFLATL